MSRFARLLVIATGAALLVAVTAGPLAAASSTKKTYSATVDPTTLAYQTPSITQSFTVTYTNTTPGGTSTINSLLLTAPTGYAIDTASASFTTNPASTAGNLAATATSITLTNLNPLTYTQSVTLSFSATIATTNLTCSGAVGTWGTQAWTGSNTSGTLFSLSSPAPTTTIGTTLAAGAHTTVNGVTVTNDSMTTCVPVTISRNGNSTQVLKPNVAGVPLTVDILWDPELAQLPLPVTRVSDTYDPNLHFIAWCSGTQSAPAIPSTGDNVSCLVSENSSIYGPDPVTAGQQDVQVHDVIYLVGDWGGAR